MPLNYRLQQVGIKVETVEGTAVSPVAGDAGFNVFQADYTTDIDQFERDPLRASVGRLGPLAGIKKATMTFETELVGSGSITTAPPIATVLAACGYSQITLSSMTVANLTGTFVPGELIEGATSGSYTVVAHDVRNDILYVDKGGTSLVGSPVTGSVSGAFCDLAAITDDVGFAFHPDSARIRGNGSSYTVARHVDGIRQRIRGCRGNVTLSATTGDRFVMQVEMMGAHEDVTDTALLSGIVYPSQVPPQFLSSEVTVQGFDNETEGLIIDGFEINTGNNIEVRPDAGTASGAIAAVITNRQPTGNVNIEAPASISDLDVYSNTFSNTEGVIQVSAGTTAGNKFIIQIPNAQFNGVNEEDRAGIMAYGIDFSGNESASVIDRDVIILAV